MQKEAPNYLINLIPKCEAAIRTRKNNFPSYNCRTDCFKYSFFPSTLNDWFRLDINIRNSEPVSLFKSSRLLSFIPPNQSNMYSIFHPIHLKLLTRLHLGFSHQFGNWRYYTLLSTLPTVCKPSLRSYE